MRGLARRLDDEAAEIERRAASSPAAIWLFQQRRNTRLEIRKNIHSLRQAR